MNKIEIKFNRAKLFGFALLAALFVIGGIFLIFVAKETRGKIAGWSALLFFGLCLAVFVKQIFYTAPRLMLDDEGIEDKSLGIGKIFWRDIEAAYPNNILMNKFISLKVTDVEKYLRKSTKSQQKIASYNQSLGFETLNLNLVGLAVSQKELLAEIEARLAAAKF